VITRVMLVIAKVMYLLAMHITRAVLCPDIRTATNKPSQTCLSLSWAVLNSASNRLITIAAQEALSLAAEEFHSPGFCFCFVLLLLLFCNASCGCCSHPPTLIPRCVVNLHAVWRSVP
jgi:hypothetical protein